ncbi:MAG TPA: RES family NAD+ phosphorylase [Candidatus Aquilonibacter sp.]|nr:RES family NAD+ phosphorylase [Candidatus Aquilonibacter sp.]
MTPPLRQINRDGMHRLIPSRYSDGKAVLNDVADDDEMLEKLIRLDGATNDRIQGEQFGLPGISTYELVYGIPNAHIVRASFLHPGPTGSRFNVSSRGAWYAADELETSLAEVSYHKAKHLAAIVVPKSPAGVPEMESSTYDDWLADFHAEFHSLEPASAYAECLAPEPVPECYTAPQKLAQKLLKEQSNGILYPSVRKKGGRCLVCFRPALVYRPRRDKRYLISFRWERNRYRTEVHQAPSNGN